MNHEKEQTGGAPQQGAGRDKQSASRMIFWRIVIAVVGGAIGVGVLFGIDSLLVLFGLKGLAAFLVPVIFAFYVIAALAFGFIFYLASPAIIVFFRKLSDYIEKKIDDIVKNVYGGEGAEFSEIAREKIAEAEARGYGKLPVIVAKTQYSLSDDAKLLARPQGVKVRVRDIIVKGGAECIVAVAGNIMLMPGLGAHPAAERIDVDENGEIVGLS